ncbi:GntR family transcriptional regulator [Peribacillus alkalitolerans]|uniref:GntR family transcriptional regulator n=1 Tax=Peribacillus alkalitolerans TaxID=1550385 RepID=UPI0013D5D274|nr:GntR family transcriptional regulator [Peribacillus alkalitolerans]
MGEVFQSSKPIYVQIADRISQRIARNDLKPGEKLPSVREMAIQSGVNPNTIQRTYSELERMKIVETKRGQGTFVTEEVEILKQVKIQLQNEIIEHFISNMKELGLTEDEMLASIKTRLSQKGGSS